METFWKLNVKNGVHVLEYSNTPRKYLLMLRRRVLHLRLRYLHYKWRKVNRALAAYPDQFVIGDWTWKGDKTLKESDNDT